MWPTLIWLIFLWSSFEASLRRLLTNAVTADFAEVSGEVVLRTTGLTFESAANIVAPFFIASFIMAVLISILDKGGILFSGKPITPDFNRMNPVEGFKRIFSMRTAAESGYGLIRMLVFAGCAVAVLWAAVDVLQFVQSCGLLCASQARDAQSILFWYCSFLFLLPQRWSTSCSAGVCSRMRCACPTPK